jgi:hypothetical protein
MLFVFEDGLADPSLTRFSPSIGGFRPKKGKRTNLTLQVGAARR